MASLTNRQFEQKYGIGSREIPRHSALALAALRHGTPRAELIKPSLDRNLLRPLGEQLGGPDAKVRAAMVIAQCTGFSILNQMLRPRALAEAQQEELVVLLKESLAACIGPLPRKGRRNPRG